MLDWLGLSITASSESTSLGQENGWRCFHSSTASARPDMRAATTKQSEVEHLSQSFIDTTIKYQKFSELGTNEPVKVGYNTTKRLFKSNKDMGASSRQESSGTRTPLFFN